MENELKFLEQYVALSLHISGVGIKNLLELEDMNTLQIDVIACQRGSVTLYELLEHLA